MSNRNQRVTPEVTQAFQLDVAATPVNKLQTYRPDYSEAESTKAMYDGLARLGQGIMEASPALQQYARSNTIAAYEKTTDKNKKDWAEVSKNIKGMAKFNPYNKDVYNSIRAVETTRASWEQLQNIPEIEKKTPDEFNAILENNRNNLFKRLQDEGIPAKSSADYLVDYDNQVQYLKYNYATKNAEYNFKLTQNKIASETGYQLGANLYKAQDKTAVMKTALDKSVQNMTALGWAADTQAEVLVNGLQSFIVNNPDMADSATIVASLKGYSINGKPLSEIIPNFDYNVHKMVMDAKRANYEDRHLDWQEHQLNLEINNAQATKDFYDYYKQNPNASPQELLSFAQNKIDEYGLEEVGFSFIKSIVNDRDLLTDLKTIPSNPDTLQELGAKAALGTLTETDISQAMRDRQINARDGFALIDRLNREAKAEATAVKSDFTALNQKFSKNGVYGQAFRTSPKTLKEFQSKANQIILNANSGVITPEVAREQLNQLDRIAAAKARVGQVKATNDSFLLNASYIKAQSVPAYNRETATRAFKQLGLLRGKAGQRIQTQITSAPTSSRTINGRTSAHKGYDLAATTQTRINNCGMVGQVIYAGYLNDFGNYAVVKYANGSYARFGHLSTSTRHLQGKTIPPNAYIGQAGSTGRSTGVHLHVDFWDKNRHLISAEQFAQGIR